MALVHLDSGFALSSTRMANHWQILSAHVHVCCLQVAELNAKVQELEAQFNAAVEDKEAAIRESERCQLKLQLANRLINALASEGELLDSQPSKALMVAIHKPCCFSCNLRHECTQAHNNLHEQKLMFV